MKRSPFLVRQDAAFAAHPFGYEHPAHARRPDHSGGMELNVFHVDQLRAGVVGERMAVTRAIPTVARDLVGFADAAGREDDGFRAKNSESSAFAIVTKRPANSPAILQQSEDAHFHVHIDALVHAVILQGADHFQAGTIADVREARIFMAAEISLQNPAIFRAIENRAPRFELAHPRGRLPGMQFRHPPVVDVLPAAHRVGEMHLPVVAIVHIGERGGDAAFRHHGVGFPEKTF